MAEMRSEPSLKQFIEDYYKVLTVMGVFGGLTALFIRLENGEFIASISLVLFLLLGLDLVINLANLKKENLSFSLMIFGLFLALFIGLVAGYMVFFYWQVLIVLSLSVVISAVIALAYSWMKKGP